MRATPTWNKARRSSKLPAQIAPAAAAAQRSRPPHLITTVSRAAKVALRVLRRSYEAKQPRKPRDLYLRRSCVRWHNVRHFSQTVPLTVKLRGRTEAPANGAEGAQFPSARGANPEAHHGPLQRLLGAMKRHAAVSTACVLHKVVRIGKCPLTAVETAKLGNASGYPSPEYAPG
jgi:hypothetical protein